MLTTKHWHGDTAFDGVDETRRVSLAKHTRHMLADVEEVEGNLEVGEAVVGANVVAVDARVLGGDGDGGDGDGEEVGDVEADGIGGGGAGDDGGTIGVICRRRPPCGGGVSGGGGEGWEVDEAAIEVDNEVLDGGAPSGGAAGANVEAARTPRERQGLDPGEVTGTARGSLADEVGVDVEVVVGNYAEILIFPAMEVEHDSISAHELGILAH